VPTRSRAADDARAALAGGATARGIAGASPATAGVTAAGAASGVRVVALCAEQAATAANMPIWQSALTIANVPFSSASRSDKHRLAGTFSTLMARRADCQLELA
jgi:hypothetical protein